MLFILACSSLEKQDAKFQEIVLDSELASFLEENNVSIDMSETYLLREQIAEFINNLSRMMKVKKLEQFIKERPTLEEVISYMEKNRVEIEVLSLSLDASYTAIGIFAINGRWDCVEYYVKEWLFDINSVVDTKGNTPLLLAAYLMDKEGIEKLIELGAKVSLDSGLIVNDIYQDIFSIFEYSESFEDLEEQIDNEETIESDFLEILGLIVCSDKSQYVKERLSSLYGKIEKIFDNSANI